MGAHLHDFAANVMCLFPFALYRTLHITLCHVVGLQQGTNAPGSTSIEDVIHNYRAELHASWLRCTNTSNY